MSQSLKRVLLFFALLEAIANSCEAQIKNDIFFETAYLHQMDSQLLANFVNTAAHNYKTFWHDLMNKNHDVALPYRIPQIIHFVWLGNPLPQKYLNNVKTWQQHHPNWTFYFWDEQSVEKEFQNKLENQEIFDNALRSKSYGEASDIVRYEILKRFGGLYVDYDTVCLRNFDILHQNFNFYTGLVPFRKNVDVDQLCNNSLIGAIPNHPVLELITSEIKTDYILRCKNIKLDLNFIKAWEPFPDIDYQQASKNIIVVVLTGPGCLTRNLATYYSQANKETIDLTFCAPSTYFCHGPGSIFADHKSDCAWVVNKFLTRLC